MDYTNLKTYKIQMKYIKKIYEIKISEIHYLNKIKELKNLIKVYENVFDNDDVSTVRSDICSLEGKIQEDKQLIKKYSDLIEHLEILCCSGGDKGTKYLDEKPKNARFIKVLRTLRKNTKIYYDLQ